MPEAAQLPTRNKILAALPAEEYDRLLGRLRPVSLTLGATLHEQEGRIEYVYLVSEGVVSHVTHMGDGGSVEVGLVGSEGMLGLPVALGDDVSPNHAIVQLEGGAMRTEAAALREELGRGADSKACCCATGWPRTSRPRRRRPATAATTSAAGSRAGS